MVGRSTLQYDLALEYSQNDGRCQLVCMLINVIPKASILSVFSMLDYVACVVLFCFVCCSVNNDIKWATQACVLLIMLFFHLMICG